MFRNVRQTAFEFVKGALFILNCHSEKIKTTENQASVSDKTLQKRCRSETLCTSKDAVENPKPTKAPQKSTKHDIAQQQLDSDSAIDIENGWNEISFSESGESPSGSSSFKTNNNEPSDSFSSSAFDEFNPWK